MVPLSTHCSLCLSPPALNRSVSSTHTLARTTACRVLTMGSPFPSPPPPPPTTSSPLLVTVHSAHHPHRHCESSLPRLPLLPMATSVHSSSTSTVVLTSSSASPSSPCHRVHFDQTCVLIPETTEPPAIRLTAKTYAIPTWARLGRPSSFHEPPTITVKLPRLVGPTRDVNPAHNLT